jgi:predicted RNA binding protein YcfA (HicA-like mRNA interferase family)
MKIPRDISGKELVNLLKKFDYQVVRQTGSHIRLTRKSTLDHHITIPLHNPIKIGTLDSILKDVAKHLQTTKNDLINML